VKTIILLIDWDSTLFWREPAEGGPVDEGVLPVSSDLKQQLKEYQKNYLELYFQDKHGDIPALENRLLDDTGLELWQRLRAELAGKYRVLFHSDEFGCDFDSPEEFIATRKCAHQNRV